MSVTLLKTIADLQISLAAAVSVGATTATLSTAVDSEGTTIPSGKYGFTIDGDTSSKEYIVCDLVGTALTNVTSISVQGASTVGFTKYHRFGATVTITDWAIFSRILANLTATTGFDSGTALKYDGQPALSDVTAIPTVQYVLDTAAGSPVAINSTVIAGDAGETVADGEWVYYNTTDGEWYLTDADDTAKCLNVQIGKARGAGTNGNAITGGIFIAGIETAGTYVAGTTYYIGNTPGALSTSAGTNSVVVGVGDANGDLILRKPTPSQTDAMVGGGAFGSPSTVNKFATEDYLVTNTPTPIYATGSTTRDPSTASGDQVIAHGMSVTPKKVRLRSVYTSGTTSIISEGIWMNGAYAATSIGFNDGGNDAVVASTAFALLLTSDADLVARSTCTVTVDATNITLAWTKTGSPSSVTVTFTWEAEGLTVFP